MNRGKIPYDMLLAYTTRVLEKLGYAKEQAEVTAWVLAEADARGWPLTASPDSCSTSPISATDTHSPRRRSRSSTRRLCPSRSMAQRDRRLHRPVHDGSRRRKGKAHGRGLRRGPQFQSLRDGRVVGGNGRRRGFIGMAFCNTRICAIPTFGRERILGTNPICIAIPSSGKTPFLLDMATTTVAHGKIEVCERRNKPLPVGWVVDENGNDTTDTAHFQKLFRSDRPTADTCSSAGPARSWGAQGLRPRPVCGSPVRRIVPGLLQPSHLQRKGGSIGQFFGAVRTDLFGNPAQIADHVESILQEIRQSAKAAGTTGSSFTGKRKRRSGRSRWRKESRSTMPPGRCSTITPRDSAWTN